MHCEYLRSRDGFITNSPVATLVYPQQVPPLTAPQLKYKSMVDSRVAKPVIIPNVVFVGNAELLASHCSQV